MNIIGLLKTIILNFYYFDFRTALRHPIKCAGNVKIEHLGKRGSIEVEENSHICIGQKGSFGLGLYRPTYWNIGPKGKVIVRGTASICRGSQIIADGLIEFGNHFYCNSNCIINAGERIIFGDDCLLGWNVTVMDGDGHKTGGGYPYESVSIGNHVWLASDSIILKGCSIGDGSVVAARAVVTRKFSKKALLIGNCNQILKENIFWDK